MDAHTRLLPQLCKGHNVLFQHGMDEPFECDKRGNLRGCRYHGLQVLMHLKVLNLRLAQWFLTAKTKERFQPVHPRSEERRVGKECRSRWSPYRCKKKM